MSALSDWCDANGATVTVLDGPEEFTERVPGLGRFTRRRYRLRVTAAPWTGSVDVDWTQGDGIRTTPDDDPAGVLYCLAADAAAGEFTFREFCEEFGYTGEDAGNPADLHETWEACRKVRADLLAAGVDVDALRDLEH